jgi:hypothetical protein
MKHADGEIVFPSGRLISPSAKTFFHLEDRFRRRPKRFSAWKIDFAVGVDEFASIELGFQRKLYENRQKEETPVMFRR